MTDRPKESGRYIEAVLKSLDVLDCFKGAPNLSLMDIMERAGLTRSRAMRLTGTLEYRGYLTQDPVTRRFSLGYRLLALGRSIEANNSLIAATRPVLKKLAEVTGESAALFVIDGLDRVVLAREESTWSIRYSVSEGERIPLPAGAGGKVLAAFGPTALWNRIQRSQPRPLKSGGTGINLGQLQQERTQILNQGFATSIGERVPDSWAASVPIFDAQDALVGCITVAGPVNRITSERQDEIIRILLEQSQHLSSSLGWRDHGHRP